LTEGEAPDRYANELEKIQINTSQSQVTPRRRAWSSGLADRVDEQTIPSEGEMSDVNGIPRLQEQFRNGRGKEWSTVRMPWVLLFAQYRLRATFYIVVESGGDDFSSARGQTQS
jgi:hypothetical protein